MDFKLRSNNKTRKGFSQFTQKTFSLLIKHQDNQ